MTGIVHELRTSLYQEFTVTGRDREIYALRPHLAKYGSPAGTFYMEVQDSSGQVIATSESFTASQILPDNGTYPHGYQRFLISCALKVGRVIRVALKASGYTFSESAYIGWLNDYDLRSNAISYTPASDLEAPLDVQFADVEHFQRGAS
jgi:hypothetical protein